jgi:hypothetical protein
MNDTIDANKKFQEASIRWFLKGKGWKELTSKAWLNPIDASIKTIWEAYEI